MNPWVSGNSGHGRVGAPPNTRCTWDPFAPAGPGWGWGASRPHFKNRR